MVGLTITTSRPLPGILRRSYQRNTNCSIFVCNLHNHRYKYRRQHLYHRHNPGQRCCPDHHISELLHHAHKRNSHDKSSPNVQRRNRDLLVSFTDTACGNHSHEFRWYDLRHTNISHVFCNLHHHSNQLWRHRYRNNHHRGQRHPTVDWVFSEFIHTHEGQCDVDSIPNTLRNWSSRFVVRFPKFTSRDLPRYIHW